MKKRTAGSFGKLHDTKNSLAMKALERGFAFCFKLLNELKLDDFGVPKLLVCEGCIFTKRFEVENLNVFNVEKRNNFGTTASRFIKKHPMESHFSKSTGPLNVKFANQVY